MTRRFLLFCWILLATSVGLAADQDRYIVRASLGLTGLQNICQLLGCTVVEGIDGSLGQVFLVQISSELNFPGEENLDAIFLGRLLSQVGIVDAEPDLTLQLQNLTAPEGLWDTTPVNYYGTSAWDGYVHQPAVHLINLDTARSAFGVTGAGIVAVIDTGVDPTQPVLQNVLLPGYDFTRNQQGGSETGDVNQSTMAVVNGASPAQVNQSTMAVVNQDAANYISQPQYAAFGHGTMVSGIIHLVAPTAQIMPLKAFQASGSGYLSDVLRSIYFATQNHANVLNMSFDFTTNSTELGKAVDYATDRGVVAVASVGNNGQAMMVYPAGLNDVMGIASTSNNDTLSSFSNYGQPPVWVGAPGEGIITTYPFGTYAAGWGTSFSAPFVSGTVALLRSLSGGLNEWSAAKVIANGAQPTSSGFALGYGLLNVDESLEVWQRMLQ